MPTTPSSIAHALHTANLPRVEARLLMQHVLDVNHAHLIAHSETPLNPAQHTHFLALCQRRLAGEPIAYLIGYREFYGRPFQVTPDVLIPRPDTELIIETLLARLSPNQAHCIADIGTGSGCIALTLALEAPNWSLHAIDISAPALNIAKANAERLGASLTFHLSDMFSALPQTQFTAIVSNPPYIPVDDPHLEQGDLRFEPTQALTDQSDGLTFYRHLAHTAPQHLHPGGLLCVEHGFDQGESVPALLLKTGWTNIETLKDLSGLPRVTLAQWFPA